MSKVFNKLQALLFSATLSPWIAGMLGAALLFLMMHVINAMPQPIATVDITGIVNQFVQSQAKLNLPPKELQARVNRLGHQLQLVLNQVARERHVILLMQEAVVAGAEDLTPLIKQRLQSETQ